MEGENPKILKRKNLTRESFCNYTSDKDAVQKKYPTNKFCTAFHNTKAKELSISSQVQ